MLQLIHERNSRVATIIISAGGDFQNLWAPIDAISGQGVEQICLDISAQEILYELDIFCINEAIGQAEQEGIGVNLLLHHELPPEMRTAIKTGGIK